MAAFRDPIARRRFVKELNGPAAVRSLLGDPRWSWIWLPVRLYAGWLWLAAGRAKVGAPAWTGSDAGAALGRFVQGAVDKASGAHPAVQSWYASFLHGMVLPHAAAWSQAVAWGEVLVGMGLILGAFTAVAAFFGGLMNLNYLLSGSISTNPNLLVIAIVLMLAWKTAGAWGLDRWLLPAVGTPWQPGLAFSDGRATAPIAVGQESAG